MLCMMVEGEAPTSPRFMDAAPRRQPPAASRRSTQQGRHGAVCVWRADREVNDRPSSRYTLASCSTWILLRSGWET